MKKPGGLAPGAAAVSPGEVSKKGQCRLWALRLYDAFLEQLPISIDLGFRVPKTVSVGLFENDRLMNR